jgi:hypothetical protein
MFKFWNEDEVFDMTVSHDFVPSEAFVATGNLCNPGAFFCPALLICQNLKVC